MELVGGALKGEIIPPGRGLTLVVVPHPLSTWSVAIESAAGLTLEELERRARSIAGPGCRFRFIALINDDVVASTIWHRVRPKAGTIVTMRSVAEFGGDNSIIRTLLSVAVAVGGAVLSAINPLAGTLLTLGGQMLVNALFPVSVAPAEQLAAPTAAADSYAIAGGRNQANPYGVIPVVLGRWRVYADLGAKTYTEFVGNDQYFRMLVVWGYGPLEISSIKIGETPIESFDGVEIETRYGYPGDAPVTLYPSEVEQEDMSVELTAAGGAVIRTTAANITEISGDLVAPGGMLSLDANNATQPYTVHIRVEFSLAGENNWTLLDTVTFTGRSRDLIRKGYRKSVAAGQYDVRHTKISGDANSDNVVEQVLLTALRGFRSNPPIKDGEPLAHSAIRIKASSQFNGVIDELNAMCASRVKAFNGANWIDDTVSNWPSDLFRHVAQGPANARTTPDAKIDLAALEAWWAYCVAKGWRFNQFRNFSGSKREALQSIAAAGRATLVDNNGKLSVVWDQPDAPIVQYFTPRNSWGFRGSRTYRRLPHGWRVRFVNEDAGYAQDERIVYDDGYDEENATLFEGIEFPGITDSDLIWKHGRFHIAQARLRPESYTLNTDFEHLACRRGSRVGVTHDVPMWGLGSGRVKAVESNVDGDDAVTLDELVKMEGDKTYCIRFRLEDGSWIVRTVTTDDGEQGTLQLDGHGDLPAAGALFMFGETDAETVILRVSDIQRGPNYTAILTLVDDAPEISLADQGVIPAFDSQITIPEDPFTAKPVNLLVTEAFEGVEGATQTGVLFAWTVLAGSTPIGFEVEYRDDDGNPVWVSHALVNAPLTMTLIPGLLRGRWSFQVRSVFADGTFSGWSRLELVDVTAGAGLQLPNVTNFVTSYDDATAGLKWDKVRFSKFEVFYEIRKGADWETGLTVASQLADPPFALTGNGTYWIKAKAQPIAGTTIYSPDADSITIGGAILVRNVLATHDEKLDGWDGTITGPAIVDGEFVRTTESGVIAYYEIAGTKIFDNGHLRPIRIESSLQAVGVSVTDDFLSNPDILNTADIFSSALTQQIEAWVEIAEALDLDEDVYAGQNVYDSPDIYQGSINYADWRKFVPGQYLNRFSKLRVALRSNNAGVHAALLEWVVVGDVPDRVDHVTNHALDADGETFVFKPDGNELARPFLGGHNGAELPNVQVTWSQVAGDQLVITGLTLEQVTIQIRNAGVGVARTIDAIFQGW